MIEKTPRIYGQARLWTEDEDNLLRELHLANYSWAAIANGLDRTVSACQTRWTTLKRMDRRAQMKKPRPEPKGTWPSKDNKVEGDPINAGDYKFSVKNTEGRDPLLDRLVGGLK